MYKADLPPDPRETAKIEARRFREEQRKSRIFDHTKQGPDVEALSAQIEEKKRRAAEEREYNATLDAETLRHAKIIELLEFRQEQDRKALEKADLEFRATNQLANTRREFDLNDPAALKKTAQTREGDEDSRLGASSLQVFQGEDLTATQRKQLQAEQQRQWLQQQRQLEKAKKEAEELEQKTSELQELQKTVYVRDALSAEHARRKQQEKETAEYNKALAEAKVAQSKQAKAQELQQNAQEQISTYNGGLLSEDPEAAVPAAGSPMKVLPDRYKGMSEAQRQGYRSAQLEQMEERKRAAEAEATARAQLEKQTVLISKTMQLREHEVARQRQELQRAQAAENAALAAEQKARRDYENKIAARNVVEPHFYDQFNKSSR